MRWIAALTAAAACAAVFVPALPARIAGVVAAPARIAGVPIWPAQVAGVAAGAAQAAGAAPGSVQAAAPGAAPLPVARPGAEEEAPTAPDAAAGATAEGAAGGAAGATAEDAAGGAATDGGEAEREPGAAPRKLHIPLSPGGLAPVAPPLTLAPRGGASAPDAAPAPDARAAAEAQERDSDRCQALVATDPVAARELARDWGRRGGGVPAAVCEALALEAQGALGTAAARLEDAGRRAPDGAIPDAARAALFEVAAGFRLRALQPEAALAAAEAGLALPGAGPVLMREKGEALAALGRETEALAALNAALAADPSDLPGLRLRARLRLEAGDPRGAADDAGRVAATGGRDADIWLLLGQAQAEAGETARARESLLRAVSLDRDGPVGDRARLALQRLALKADPAAPATPDGTQSATQPGTLDATGGPAPGASAAPAASETLPPAVGAPADGGAMGAAPADGGAADAAPSGEAASSGTTTGKAATGEAASGGTTTGGAGSEGTAGAGAATVPPVSP